jgi:uridine kinase
MPRPSPQTVDWAGAGEAIERLLAAMPVAAPGGVVVGITGPPGAGKSLLARRLSACIVATDDYLPDYDQVAPHHRDLPEAADLVRLAADVAALRRGEPAQVPVWSFHTHRRESYRRQEPHARIVCEGLHALHERVLPSIDLRVYVEASSAVRWSRVEARERAGERGWGVEAAREFFHSVAEPTYARLAPVYRARADVIVLND